MHNASIAAPETTSVDLRLPCLAAALCVGLTAWAGPAPLYPVVVPDTPDPLFANLAIPATAAQQGMWSSTQGWPLMGIHLTVLPDGRVLSFGSPTGQGIQDGRTFDLWNPALGFSPASHLLIANGDTVDSFCATAAILPASGAILVSGGGSTVDGYTAFASTIVTPVSSTAVNAGVNLAAQRWYATMITLADGRALMTGGGTPYAIVKAYADPAGAQPNISTTPEVYTPGSGWSSLFNATSNDAFGPVNNRAWYPRQWVAPNGTVFGISTDILWSLDPAAGTIKTLGTFKTTVNTTTLPNVGPTSTAVMFDTGRILQVGGNGYYNGYPSPSSASATVFDINAAGAPKITETARMAYARQWPNSLVLLDGKVLVTGGSTYADNSGSNAVYAAETWTPATGKWTLGASAANYRGYHSTTALLPSGAVLSAGGGAPGPATNLNAEIYYPAHLFTAVNGASVLANRPRIVSLSANAVDHGSTLTVQLAGTTPISEVALLGASSVTHGFNTTQRRLKLNFTQNGSILTVRLPATAALAPPGYYLLTALDANRTPSAGVMLGVHAAPPPSPQASATALLPLDKVPRSIEATNYPGFVVRHQNFYGYLNHITPASPAGDRDDSSFSVRGGLAAEGCYSFESKNYPGYFLRQQNDRVGLASNDKSTGFAQDATFCAQAGLSGNGFSLRSYRYPDRLVRHRNFEILLEPNDGSALFAQDASFYFTQQYLPVDGQTHSIASVAQPGNVVRHASFVGYIADVNTAASPLERADSSFYVRQGAADAACYSFEALNYPGYFLRNANPTVQLSQSDGSAQFAADSTFCLGAGAAGQGFSLSLYGSPNLYLRQSNFQLYLNANDGTAQFARDASFNLVPANAH